MDRVQLKIEDRLLEVVLTPQERWERADQAAEASARASDLHMEEEKFKAAAKEKKEGAEGLERDAGRLLSIYRKGKENRLVPVATYYSDADKSVHVVRQDTLEELMVRTPTAQEMQAVQQLTIDDEVAKKRRGKGQN